jgi:hypothetical protein
MKQSRKSFGVQIASIAAVPLFIGLCSSIYTVQHSRDVGRAVTRLATSDIEGLTLVLNIDRDAYQAQLALERYELSTSTDAASAALESWTDNRGDVVDRMDQLAALGLAAADIEASAALRDAWFAQADPTMAAAQMVLSASMQQRRSQTFENR